MTEHSKEKEKESRQEAFTPFIKPEQHVTEFTFRAIFLGSVLGIVFGAANAYLGMKVGMTISASIPAAVISMAILRGVLKRGTILENNMVQTIASSGESLAAGVIFTIPGFLVLRYLLRWDGVPEHQLPNLPSVMLTFLMTLIGGFIGALMMIPLRRYLIVKEHRKLPFPEGTACAQVLQAGEEGGVRAKHVFNGIGLGALYMFLMKGLKFWKDEAMWMIPRFQKGAVGIEPSAALLGVGFIIGPKIAAYMFAGGVLGWLVFMPLFGLVGSFAPDLIIPPAAKPISQLNSWQIASAYIRYIGAGAVAMGGIVSLIKAFPVIISSFGHSMKGLARRIGEKSRTLEPRTDRDLPMWIVFGGSFLMAIAIGAVLYVVARGVGIAQAGTLSFAGGFVAILFSFFFITVAARIVGIVGSSSSPVSGMTITSLLAVCLTLVGSGLVTPETSVAAMVVALSAGAMICIAVCSSGDISQDLKTGFLLGATPWKQQLAELLAVIVPTMSIVGTIYLLLLQGGGLNTLPVYEGRVNFRSDPIVRETYAGKLTEATPILKKMQVVINNGQGEKAVHALAFESYGTPMITALDVLTLGSRQQTRRYPTRGRRRPRAAGDRRLEGKLLEKSQEGVLFLTLDGRKAAFTHQEIVSITRGAKISSLVYPKGLTLDPDNHNLYFQSPRYGLIPAGLNLVLLANGAALEGKVFLKGHTPAGGEWIMFRGVEGDVSRLESNQYRQVISYDDKMGELRAPQANIMAILVKGIIDGKLPWALVFLGIMMAGVVELLGISSLPFAIGLYLGIATNAAIMLGGLIFWVAMRVTKNYWAEAEQKGTLLASGIIAGDALMGILLAFLAMAGLSDALGVRQLTDHHWEDGVTLAAFLAFTFLLAYLTMKKDRRKLT
ncbi:MAG: oligopeptide transporter, OPT family [Elusimicrobia bacterium]|nr:oligopeptide transporter, OPT family [Elusimicrobiota bacterium]